MAPRVGLEPTTNGLTVELTQSLCSGNPKKFKRFSYSNFPAIRNPSLYRNLPVRVDRKTSNLWLSSWRESVLTTLYICSNHTRTRTGPESFSKNYRSDRTCAGVVVSVVRG